MTGSGAGSGGRGPRAEVSARRARALGLAAALAAVAALALGCENAGAGKEHPGGGSALPALPAPPAALSAPSASASSSSEAAGARAPISDEAFGRMVTRLSEPAGKFPSDNFTSNETSYLDVMPALSAPALRGGAYLGVGPEQNFTYLAALEPELAFIADIRRENLLLHLVYKVLFERSASRAEFLAGLLSRALVPGGAGTPGEGAGAYELLTFVGALSRSPERQTELFEATARRCKALGIPLDAEDRKHLLSAVDAFAARGLGIRYSMDGSARRYPSLGELMAMKDDAGAQRSFLGSEAAFRAAQRLERENRVVPFVADLAGDGAMPRLAQELIGRGLALRVGYVSNVEQYLFAPGVWPKWVRNVAAMPWAPGAILVRVYFDQGKAHPLQRPGHRTTTLTQPAADFLKRARGEGWKSWWEVATR